MRRTKLYSISTEDSYKSPWAQGAKLIWTDSEPERKSRSVDLQASPTLDLAEVSQRAGISVNEDGRQWPDWLRAADWELSYYVSERVVQSLIDEDIPFRRAVEFTIAEVHNPALRKSPPPKYFVVEVEPGIEFGTFHADAASPLNPSTNKEPQGALLRGKTRYLAKYDTWDGSPLFTARDPEPEKQEYTRLYCDHRVTFLAMKEKWTNFEAVPLEVI